MADGRWIGRGGGGITIKGGDGIRAHVYRSGHKGGRGGDGIRYSWLLLGCQGWQQGSLLQGLPKKGRRVSFFMFRTPYNMLVSTHICMPCPHTDGRGGWGKPVGPRFP